MEYPSNSHRKNDDEEPKKLERIIEGEVVRRKKPLGKRFKETFLLGGNAKDVWGHVLFEILIPAARDMVADAGNSFFERMVYGDSYRGGRRNKSRHGNSYGHVDYQSNFTSNSVRRRDEPRNMSRKARASHDFGEIILEKRFEAEEIIDNLFNSIEKFGSVTVADLYDMLGVESNYTDRKWGWIEFQGARVSRVRGGYLLDLPKPEPLD